MEEENNTIKKDKSNFLIYNLNFQKQKIIFKNRIKFKIEQHPFISFNINNILISLTVISKEFVLYLQSKISLN